jgi:hypothetical protein
MLRTKKHHTDTAELDRQVIAELSPQVKRRASARVPVTQTTEPVPAWKSTNNKPLSRGRIYAILILGCFCGLLLLILGTIIANGVGDLQAHFHGGDSGIITLDADTGRGTGVSHLLAFYQSGHVVVVECSHDYQKSTIASVQLGSESTSHRVVNLSMRTIDGKQALLIALENSITFVLYNTGDGWSQNLPQS